MENCAQSLNAEKIMMMINKKITPIHHSNSTLENILYINLYMKNINDIFNEIYIYLHDKSSEKIQMYNKIMRDGVTALMWRARTVVSQSCPNGD